MQSLKSIGVVEVRERQFAIPKNLQSVCEVMETKTRLEAPILARFGRKRVDKEKKMRQFRGRSYGTKQLEIEHPEAISNARYNQERLRQCKRNT